MIIEKVQVKNKIGLHARPATLFVSEAKDFKSSIRIKLGDKEINGKSILEVLTLGANCGSVIEIIADGEDEKQAIDALRSIVDSDE